MNNDIIINGACIIAIAILLFFLLREVMCWYYKINKQIELQKETNDLLSKLLQKFPNTDLPEQKEKKE
jgi:hypothetical protein